MKKHLLAMMFSSLFLSPAFAEGMQLPPITHEATKAECAACHMAFQPQMLPSRSWKALMTGLDDHFGENAQLGDAVAADISTYLMANAADANGKKNRLMRRIKDTDTPLRITETPWWVRAHNGEVSEAAFQRVGSKANCAACHRAAEKGYYEDD